MRRALTAAAALLGVGLLACLGPYPNVAEKLDALRLFMSTADVGMPVTQVARWKRSIKLLPDGFTEALAAAAILPALSPKPPPAAAGPRMPAVPVAVPMFMVLPVCASAGPASASVASSPNAISLIAVILSVSTKI